LFCLELFNIADTIEVSAISGTLSQFDVTLYIDRWDYYTIALLFTSRLCSNCGNRESMGKLHFLWNLQL